MSRARQGIYWSLIQDGDGKLYARSYNVVEDRFTTLPFPDRQAAEAHIRANSLHLVAEYDEFGQVIPSSKPQPVRIEVA